MKFKIFAALTVFLGAVNFGFAENQQFVYDDQGRRDPFWKLVSPSGSILNYETDILISEMTLEGIIFDPAGKSFAIINSNVVKPNDSIGFYLVSAIGPKKVTLMKGQEKFVLELKKEE